MVDRHRRDFQGRLGRIEHTHEAGGGFEAEGTLGMSYHNSRRRRRRMPRLLGVLTVMAVVMILLKAGMHVAIGADAYEYRVAAMKAGTQTDRFGAYILQADPVTLALVAQLRRIIR